MGQRAASGVILVTTKQGKAGKTQLSYDYNVGITKASALPDLVYNSVDYMTCIIRQIKTPVSQIKVLLLRER
jgi:hypothetical protein